jgi:hypothetical protein
LSKPLKQIYELAFSITSRQKIREHHGRIVKNTGDGVADDNNRHSLSPHIRMLRGIHEDESAAPSKPHTGTVCC